MIELFDFIVSNDKQFSRRLPSLYSDFTFQRRSNPDGYIANTTAWLNALAKAAQAGLLPARGKDHPTLSIQTGDILLRALETKDCGVPLALGSVITEAISKQLIVEYSEYLSARKSIYIQSRQFHPWNLISWGLRQVGLFEPIVGASKLPEGRYVILRNVEDAASKIIQQLGHVGNQMDKVYPMAFFRREVEKAIDIQTVLTDDDLKIILCYLERDKPVIVHDSQTVKFKASSENSSTLTDQDRTVSSLKVLIADVDLQIEHLTVRIAALAENAKAALQAQNRASAMASLRSRKLNEATLAKRSETLSQLQAAYTSIEEAVDQVAMVHVMQASTGVLRQLHAETGGLEKVEDVVQELRDEMSKVEEVSDTIEAGREGGVIIDEDAVDEELEEMERQARVEQEQQEALETQKKLASIDALEKPGVVEELSISRPTSDQSRDDRIDEGVKALKRLSLETEAVAVVESADD